MIARAVRSRSIRRKIAVLVFTASVTGVTLAAVAVAAYEFTTFRPRAIRDAATLAAILRVNTVPTLLFDDPAAARENLATLRSRPEIGAAVVFRPDGSVFASYRRLDGPPLDMEPPASGGVTSESDGFVYTTRLASDGQPVGWLRLQYTLPTLAQRLPQYAVVAAVVLVAIGTTAVLLLTALGRSVATPLRGLVGTLGRLTETRDLTLRVPTPTTDEIGTLTTAFNRLLDTLQARDAALQAGAAALRQSEAHLRLALAAADMQTWASGPASAGAMAADAMAGTPLADLVTTIHPEDRPRVERALAGAIATQANLEIEFRMLRGTEERLAVLRGHAFIDGDGTVQLLGVAQDVTDRRRLERQVLQSQKMEAIGNLAGGIAHDFNNLLTGMLGYLAFVQRQLPPDSPVRADVDQVEQAARRAAALTSQLLSYARRQMVVPTLVDLNERLHTLDSLFRRLLGEDIVVETALMPSLWTTRVDPGQLEQVVLNLAINARDAMPQGGTLSIATRNVVIGQPEAIRLGLVPGDFVELTVSDTGTGIAPEIVGRIFEPFFTTKPQGQGTGLGLAVCYGIVKQAGGDLTVETHLSRGSTFRVLLPRAAPAVPPGADHAGAADDALGGAETILLAEDDAAVRALACRVLQEVGYRVLEAEDVPAALALAETHGATIDLLVTDVVMPTQSGGALAVELRRRRPGLLVLFISGYPNDTAVRRGVMEMQAPLLAKPFTPTELRRAVRRTLDAEHSANP